MNEANRAYDILRAFVGREWSRIQGVERDLAEEELARAMDSPTKTDVASSPLATAPGATSRETALRLLGVKEAADFETVRRAYERISRRADPQRFPAGTSERVTAAEILRRVEWAYSVLTSEVDATDKRFKSLDLG